MFFYIKVPRLIEAYKVGLHFFKTEPLQTEIDEIAEPKKIPESDNEVAEIIKSNSGLAWHPVGTCKMGNAKSSETVVDEHLKVLGIERLRVIDASIMPRVVSGNTNMASMLIGAKGASLVAQDYF